MSGQSGSRGIAVRGVTYLDVPHKDGILSFATPAFDHGSHVSLRKRILDAKLELPTMEQIASFLHEAWQDPKEEYSRSMISKLGTNFLLTFNGLLYVPNEGVYIQDRPEIVWEQMPNSDHFWHKVSMERSDLDKKLEANDPSVRFVPFGYKMGVQSYGELASNPFVQALAGEEGAEKLARVSARCGEMPYVENFNSRDTWRNLPELTTLDTIPDRGVRLRIRTHTYPDAGTDGFTFGVNPKDAEGTAEK
ncbi:MAG TPA: hypothetical protein HA282_05120 [Nanoarchaeota archaeon]|nr:hypothetical protein [Candidatus Pacearchaeota archaeon]HIH17208.1 hypothetical protein [Nanoarchaeota archaeon]HIH34562.1 hypothetical protein [Nanoarchaeota archaeon]HIH51864.1 hypothetical protein [Nanoarchaeota archaeon]HIH66563.1 hypothetical protein [Nanoarchaeota archaeon]